MNMIGKLSLCEQLQTRTFRTLLPSQTHFMEFKPSSIILVVFILLTTISLTWSFQFCYDHERQVLLNFHQGVIDTDKRLASWTGKDCCKWKGVSCNNQTKHILKLDLRNSDSTVVSLKLNQVSPSFSDLKYLTYLDLSGVDLTDTQSVVFPSSLLVLRLSYCRLNDNLLFHSLENLSSLCVLNLAHNSISGPIPSEIFESLPSVEILRLNDNRLSGIIPESLGKLSQLTELDLSFKFQLLYQCSVRSPLCNTFQIEKLKFELKLSFAQCPWVPSFQLQQIHLGSCLLGPSFPHWLQTQTEILSLNISRAGISDTLPNWFKNLPSHLTVLDISHNQIRGELPDFLMRGSSSLYLYLSSNKFIGSFPRFPTNTSVLDVSNNNITGKIPTEIGLVLPKLIFLGLSNNHIYGTVATSLCKLKQLTYLDLSKNQLSGHLPQCWNEFSKLQVIDLTSNYLSGNIPSSIYQTKSLISLHLSKNSFTGVLPTGLHCPDLTALDIGENKLTGEISSSLIEEVFPSIMVIRLRSNMFCGSISRNICRLSKLQILDVAHNNLSGNIPRCFYKFSAMIMNKKEDIRDSDPTSIYEGDLKQLIKDREELKQVMKGRELMYCSLLGLLANVDLSNNKFVGQIPHEFTRLTRLRGLNLSSNELTGNIPMDIGMMTTLESLDFSRNHLSGLIPESISLIPRLSSLNLSYNHLSGPIHVGTQLQTLNDPSIYAGNNDLCGLPLPKKCKGPAIPYRNEEETSMSWVYIGITSGWTVGFWGIFGVLLLSKTWRDSYVRVVEDMAAYLVWQYQILKFKTIGD